MYGSSWFMVPLILGPVVGVIGTVFGGWMTYRAGRRVASGTVQTSNATELWQENSRLMDRLSKEVERLTFQVNALEATNARLSDENRLLHEQVKLLTAEVADLRARLHA